MVEEHAEESVDFCLDLRRYMGDVAKGELSHDELHEMAESLYAKYLPEGAPCQINVSAKARKEARKALDKNDVDPSIFAKTKNEVRDQLLLCQTFSDNTGICAVLRSSSC